MLLLGVLAFFVLSVIAYNREEQIDNALSKHLRLNKIYPFIICFFISFLFALRLPLSPFNTLIPSTDSSVFLYIGKSMYNGAVPYRDLFDHKGIVLYFIEYIGYLIGFGHQDGVWIIELLNAFATSLIFFYISRLFTKSKIVCFLSSYLALYLCSIDFLDPSLCEGGNISEEYALPWIAFSLYIVVKFFLTNEYKKWQIILIGVGFAVVFFLRVNMVGLWGALMLSVLIYFIKNKRILEIFKCFSLFIAGCLFVVVPVFIYLSITNSFNSMIEYYFIFNFTYTGAPLSGESKNFLFECITFSGVASFFIVYSFVTNYKNKAVWINFITLVFAFLSANISGRGYRHYAVILFPFFVIPAVLTMAPFMDKTKEITIPIVKTKMIMLITYVCMIGIVAYPLWSFVETLSINNSSNELLDYLEQKTSPDDDVLFLGNHVASYNLSNRSTNNKFFYQTPPIDVQNELYEEFINELDNKPSDYIIDVDDLYYDQNNIRLNHQKVIEYLNKKCEDGLYRCEKYDCFQVFVREQVEQ